VLPRARWRHASPVVRILCLLLSTFSGLAGPRDAEWKQVQAAIDKGLPKTAITNLEPIIQGALKDRAYPEAVKAIGRKITLEGTIQGNKPEEKITRLEAEIARAPKEMVPVLDALLAHWYWQYFQQNKWRFMQRTAMAAAPGRDFTTWDLPRLFGEIDRQFQSALAAEPALKATPINAWDDLLQKGTMSDSYRPTLYDFIAHEALEFYTSGEQAGAKPQDAFELTPESPIFDSAKKFTDWQPSASGDTNSLTLRAIHLYQALLRFHKDDPAPQLAFASADLERLNWGWNVAFGEDKNSRFKAGLEDFIKIHGDFDISALATEDEARVFQQEGDLVAAHKLAEHGAQLYPRSLGGKLCQNLVSEIEAKSATISTERVWNCFDGNGAKECPNIVVHYRNVDAVYFRAIPYDWEMFLQKRYNRPENLNLKERREILLKPSALEWSEKLSPTPYFKERTAALAAPGKLKPGFYFIASSHDPKFSETENIVSLAAIWVSDLSLVTRTRNGKLEGFVLDANSGEPLPGAEVFVWHLDPNGNRIADPKLASDENGFFEVKAAANRSYLLRARLAGRELATEGDVWVYDSQPDVRPTAQTVFFTDRALYRPSQTIQYKGICLWVDQDKDNYEVLKGEELTVIFRDSNGKEISRQKQRANDFGSFAGSFTAPRDRLMGQMILQAEGRAQGQTWLRVEEYKRPKFQVTLDAPKTGSKLNEKVSLTGHAMSYTGAAVDGAQLHYRIVREVRWPWWWGWFGGNWRGGESQEIAHGSTSTETDGSFKIDFVARPDPKVAEKDDPTFVFRIDADVTDTAGETRSADRSIRIGYTALEATLSADDWQTEDQPVEISIHTKTLDEEPQVAEGGVKVYELQPPDKVHRAPLAGAQPFRYRVPGASEDQTAQDLSNPNNWALGKLIDQKGFTTDTNGTATLSFKLAAGAYRAVLETQDRFGKKVSGQLPLQVLKPDDTRLAIEVPHLIAAPKWDMQPGGEFLAVWGTGYETGRAFIEIEHRHQMVQRYWTKAGQTQQQIKLAVTEAMRGGFTLHMTQVRENRAYLQSRKIEVPWRNKELDIKWEHFVSKLQPGQKETWTAVISKGDTGKSSDPSIHQSTPSSEQFAAELVATLYDESLDAFAPHGWPQRFNIFRQEYSNLQPQFGNSEEPFQQVFGGWGRYYQNVQITFRSFPRDLVENLRGFQWQHGVPLAQRSLNEPTGMALPEQRKLGVAMESAAFGGAATITPLTAAKADVASYQAPPEGEPRGPTAPKLDLSQVSARKNLNEAAFFFPQLTADANGIVRLTFSMPEALTKWRFLGFAHDQSARSGYLEDHVTSSKDLMVQPNPPRFLREEDVVEFTVKVSNQSEKQQIGTVKLSFDDALTGQSADFLLKLSGTPSGAKLSASGTAANTEQPFEIPPKQSRSFSWRITVPDSCGFLTYKAVAATSSVSDGEEGAVPVLSRRILITESLPLPIRGPATKKFEFTKLLKSGGSKTLQNQSLTLQMVSNPAWYAVLALPYLMEYPHECSEQVFNRLYANALARTIANKDLKIRRVFDQWKNTPALESPLEKNQDLKSVALEETPWLRQAESESQARKNIGILFDENRLNYETQRTLEKLDQMQLADGSWPWFPGGPGNDYITLYITTGFGRLRRLGVDINVGPATRSLQRLDGWMSTEYERIQTLPEPQKYRPSATDALYLYGRSFFLKDQPIAAAQKKAVEFFLAQSRKYWLATDCRQTQAQIAIALYRFNAFKSANDSTPAAIMASLKERSVSTEELGMFWRDVELSWWWYRAPIETQALMIEAFDEVAHDQKSVEECKVWLLKQKQTQDWKTTKATADAVYALLLRGADLLSSDALVEVSLGGKLVTQSQSPRVAGPIQTVTKSDAKYTSTPVRSPSPRDEGRGDGKFTAVSTVEPGTGFYELRFSPTEIKPRLGEVTVKKFDPGVAWGSVHWQYLEDMSKVTAYEGTPLRLTKTLFTKTATNHGLMLEPVRAALHVGDELIVRVELRVDRDMEYVHLKDQRGCGTEPVNVLSQYKYQDGLAYYESTRDTATHFFIDYLPKGTYVFEYSTRVQLRGRYQSGVAEIQCMYAPEFDSHSQSPQLQVD
jgi:hypothetical protein